jgi:hypothetical protein
MTMTQKTRNTPARRVGLIATFAATALLLAAGQASASAPAPGWTLDSFAKRTNFSSDHNAQCLDGVAFSNLGLCDVYELTATNAGAAPSDGSVVTLTDDVPTGLTVQAIEFFWGGLPDDFGGPSTDLAAFGLCTPTPAPTGTAVQCQLDNNGFGLPPIAPDQTLEMIVAVTVDDPVDARQLTNSATITGGGAPDATTTASNTVGLSTPGFGPSSFSSYIAGPDGAPETQAGAHPYELSTRIDLANATRVAPDAGPSDIGIEDLKDVAVDLPLGFLGSALATPTCTFAQLSADIAGGCPADTVVGTIYSQPDGADSQIGKFGSPAKIFNLVPEHGVAAEFGFVDALAAPHVLYASVVPTPAGYVLRTTSPDIPQVSLTSIAITFFGNPTAKDGSGTTPAALFTNPSSCSGQPLVTTIHMDSWQHQGRIGADGTPDLSDPNWVSATSSSPPVTGCNKLQFNASMTVQPDTAVADSASGLDFELKVPQSTDPDTLATPPLKKAVVTLPAGVSVNPAAADGLAACSPAQIALSSAAEPSCPDASKIGTVALQSPLLPGTLTGSIFLASQDDNPFHTLLAGYIVVDDPTTGVVIKIPGRLDPDPVTGQITGTFDNNPQFPFSDLKLHFFGGNRGELATPESCGTFTTTSQLTPWSAPDSGPAATPSDTFNIDSGCVTGFAPTFAAGVTNVQAGASSPFTLSFSRSDTDQNLHGLSVTLPPGLLAKVAGVPLCSDSDANAGTCPGGSQVGSVTSGAGVGPHPLFLPGKAYLTGPYKGAPYGLAVAVPAVAGPFDLGMVVVRQALNIDPTDAHATAVSDPFPTILQGIPLRIRRVDVKLDRPGFMLNPTSCDPMAITASLTSTGGLTAPVSSRFQVGGCSDLPFAPKLKIGLSGGRSQMTPGKHPSLTATYTQAAGQANTRGVKVALPLSLALDPNNSQHVCDHDAAAAVHGGDVPCPASTIVGTATAVTPLLPNPVSGKVYLVQGIRFSKTGRKIRTLPTLLLPLRGPDGVALDLRAQSAVVAKKLVTTFGTVPDAPVSSFKLTITGGRKGILTVTGNKTFCAQPKAATVTETAQSGKQNSPTVTLTSPCSKVKAKHKHRHSRATPATGTAIQASN